MLSSAGNSSGYFLGRNIRRLYLLEKTTPSPLTPRSSNPYKCRNRPSLSYGFLALQMFQSAPALKERVECTRAVQPVAWQLSHSSDEDLSTVHSEAENQEPPDRLSVVKFSDIISSYFSCCFWRLTNLTVQ